MKIYTKTGDKGETSLFGGTRVSKDHIRIEAYGTVDELNACIGLIRDYLDADDLDLITEIQNRLFNIGSILATEKETSFPIPELKIEHIELLEQWMDKTDEGLPKLTNFILPGGHPSVAHCHLARTVCRRSERRVISLSESAEIPDNLVKYLNRLSDFLFILARKLTISNQVEELLWKKD